MLPSPSPSPLFSSSLSSSSSSSSSSTILIIISIIIALSVIACLSFHLVLHLLSRRRRRSSSPPSRLLPSLSPPASPLDSPSLPKSPDCPVCLSPLRPCDHLRFLPTCHHAFHLHCIDLWLQSTPSCPLCRCPIAPAEEPCASASSQAEVELSVSCQTSVEHLAGGDLEAAADHLSATEKEESGEVGDEEDGGGRGWLRDYLDRVASSASSSFNSLTFSGRLSSHRFDSGSLESGAAGDDRSWWDSEGADWVEESGLAGIYRWFVGM